MEELFGNLDKILERLLEGLASKLGDALKEALGNLGGFVDRLEHTIDVRLDEVNGTLKGMDEHLSRQLQSINESIILVGKNHVEAMQVQTKALVDAQDLYGKRIVNALNDKLEAVARSVTASSILLAGTETTQTAAIASGLAALNLTIGSWIALQKAKEAAELAKWGPLWLKVGVLLETVVFPLMDNPDKIVAETLAAVIKTYYNTGRDVYDALDLDEEH